MGVTQAPIPPRPGQCNLWDPISHIQEPQALPTAGGWGGWEARGARAAISLL